MRGEGIAAAICDESQVVKGVRVLCVECKHLFQERRSAVEAALLVLMASGVNHGAGSHRRVHGPKQCVQAAMLQGFAAPAGAGVIPLGDGMHETRLVAGHEHRLDAPYGDMDSGFYGKAFATMARRWHRRAGFDRARMFFHGVHAGNCLQKEFSSAKSNVTAVC